MEKMRATDAQCLYCGQQAVVMVAEGKEYTRAELDRIATMDCTCAGAEDEKKVKSKIKDAQDAIEMVLAKKNKKTVAQVMLAAVDGMARDRIKKVSINIDGKTTCSMYQKNGKIIVESRWTEVEYSDGEAQDEIDTAE